LTKGFASRVPERPRLFASQYSIQNKIKEPNHMEAGSGPPRHRIVLFVHISAVSVNPSPVSSGAQPLVREEPRTEGHHWQIKTSPADVMLFFISQVAQIVYGYHGAGAKTHTSADVVEAGVATGAMSDVSGMHMHHIHELTRFHRRL
jgi:hypothetical protein